MALELYIPPCVSDPARSRHSLPLEIPRRIQIEGPLVAIQRLLPEISTWPTDPAKTTFPQPVALELARLAFRNLYGRDAKPGLDGDLVVRDEYLGWVIDKTPYTNIDYYGVTFDHFVPPGDLDPEIFQINIIEMEIEDGPFANGEEYANKHLLFPVDATDYVGKKVLAVPRCCQTRKGTQDRGRINGGVAEREAEAEESIQK